MVRRLTEGRLSSEKALNMARAPRLRALPLVGILDTFNDEIQTSARRKNQRVGTSHQNNHQRRKHAETKSGRGLIPATPAILISFRAVTPVPMSSSQTRTPSAAISAMTAPKSFGRKGAGVSVTSIASRARRDGLTRASWAALFLRHWGSLSEARLAFTLSFKVASAANLFERKSQHLQIKRCQVFCWFLPRQDRAGRLKTRFSGAKSGERLIPVRFRLPARKNAVIRRTDMPRVQIAVEGCRGHPGF